MIDSITRFGRGRSSKQSLRKDRTAKDSMRMIHHRPSRGRIVSASARTLGGRRDVTTMPAEQQALLATLCGTRIRNWQPLKILVKCRLRCHGGQQREHRGRAASEMLVDNLEFAQRRHRP